MATLFHDRISGRRGWLPGGFGTTVVRLGSWTFQAEISRPEGGAALRALQFFADVNRPPGSAIPVQTRMMLPGEKFALGADSCQWAHKVRPGEESETGGLGRSRRKILARAEVKSFGCHVFLLM